VVIREARHDEGVGERPTLKTVADAVGVSRATVSNAYNRPDQLSPALRERILDAAQRLGYAGPDPAARGLRLGQAGTIGVLVGAALTYAFRDPATGLFLEGIARAGERAGTALLLIPSPPGEDRAAAIRSAVVDAFCLNCVPTDDPVFQAVLARRLPTAVVEGWGEDEPVARVDIDQRGGARAAAEHLVALGHRRFGIAVARLGRDGHSGPVDAERLANAVQPVSRERLLGYRDALTAAGVDWATVPVHETGGHGFAQGVAAADTLLAAEPGLTAILADSDVLALGAMRGAAAAGRRVPGDLSVAGFDDIPEAAQSQPALTTVRQPLLEKGEAAYGLLEELLAGKPPRRVELPVELVTRDSTAPPG
jgi:DNA-binding LacI/PurR family transcriptional regulator